VGRELLAHQLVGPVVDLVHAGRVVRWWDVSNCTQRRSGFSFSQHIQGVMQGIEEHLGLLTGHWKLTQVLKATPGLLNWLFAPCLSF
jgi:hypothetical protein